MPDAAPSRPPASPAPQRAETPTADARTEVPRAECALICETLTPDLQVLLRTEDPDILAARLLRLNLAGARSGDALELDAAVAELIVRRRISMFEGLSRLLVIVSTVALVAVAGLLVASFAGYAFARWFTASWLDWPPTTKVVRGVLALALVSWLAGYGVVWLRGLDKLNRARIACRLAAVHTLDSWPGMAVDAPFQQLGRRISFPAWTLIGAAVVLVVFTASVHEASFGVWLLALVWVALGVWLLRVAAPYRRAQSLAERTLFIGRPD